MRLGTGLPFKPGHRGDIEIFLEDMLMKPLSWKRSRMIFVCSMSDLFADFVPDEWIDKVFTVMAETPQHTYQVLTKRAARMREYIAGLTPQPPNGRDFSEIYATIEKAIERVPAVEWPLPNVWLGVSTERQLEADERVRLLLDTPAAIRFVSAEPLLGPIDLMRLCILPQKQGSVRAGIHIDAMRGRYCESGVAYKGDWDITGPAPPDGERRKLDWVIAGGESGNSARPMHPDWARSLRDQCLAAGLPFFFKQWGEFKPVDGLFGALNLRKRSCAIDIAGKMPQGDPMTDAGVDRITAQIETGKFQFMSAIGKKLAGRELDGRLHDAMPERTR